MKVGDYIRIHTLSGQEWYCFDNESVEHHVAFHILDKLKELKGEIIDD